MKTKAKTISAFGFTQQFLNERESVAFVEKYLWGDKSICPHCCGKETTPRPSRRGYNCKKCRKDFTYRKGAVFDNSRLPLKKWLYAIYLLQTSRKGISSLQLSKEFDVMQKTAWFLSHRLREACDLTAFPLAGIVEIDDTYIGGKKANKHATKKNARAARR